jgi:hypothetical protein
MRQPSNHVEMVIIVLVAYIEQSLLFVIACNDWVIIDKIEKQFEKQYDSRILALLGIKMDWSDDS